MEVLLDGQDLPIVRRGTRRPSLGDLPDPRIEVPREFGPHSVPLRSQGLDPIQLLGRWDHDPRPDRVHHPFLHAAIDERLCTDRVPSDVADRSRDLLGRLRDREGVCDVEVAEDPEGLVHGLGVRRVGPRCLG
jgi:hypothetical protein